MPFFKNFNTKFTFTFFNTKFTFIPKKYKKSLKKQINSNFEKNDRKIIQLFPFLFGLFQMFWSRYKEQTSFLLPFERNVPGLIKTPKENLSLTNYQNIKTKNLQEIQENEIKNLDLYENSLLVQLNKKTQKKFLGIFLTKNFNLNVVNYDAYQGFFPRATHFHTHTFFQKHFLDGIFYFSLDEFPLKIQKSYKFSIEKVSFPKENKSFPFFKYKLLANTTESSQSASGQNSMVEQLEQEDVEINHIKSLLQQKEAKKDKTKGFAFEKQKNKKAKNSVFLSKRQILQKEIDNFFHEKGFCPLFLKTEKTFKISTFKKYFFNQTLDLIDSFFPIVKKRKTYPKILSGYIYPNLSIKKTKTLGFRFVFKQKSSHTLLKINLPPFFLSFWKKDLRVPSLFFNKNFINDKKNVFFGIPLKEEKKWKKNLKKDVRTNKKGESYKLKRREFFADLKTAKFSIFEQKGLEKDPLFFYKSTKIKKNFIPFSETFINKNIGKKTVFDLIYKKRQDLAKKNKQKEIFPFFVCCEPLASKSWMILTQISFCFFLIQFVIDFYKVYAKELVEFLLNSASSSNIDIKEVIEEVKIDEEEDFYDDTYKGYRMIKKVKKGFQDIAGIDNLLPTLGEIVWFLRNSGKSLKLKKSIPKGILLVGPPGTGKTLLVQTLAGEAQIPVLVESGSLLTDPQQKITGVKRLKKLFDQARQKAPCIVFIDEIDTLGETRQKIIQTPMGTDEIIESLSSIQSFDLKDSFLPKPLNLEDTNKKQYDLDYDFFSNAEKNIDFGLGQIQQNIEKKKKRLSLLMQFLIELDGLKQREKVIVIGATNRPTVLDPALVRPGRFDQILHLALPSRQKRLDILKLYTKKLAIEKKISWNYLANRTKGLSAADIAGIMNHSALQAIYKKTIHNLETIERGINLITNYSLDFSVFESKKKIKDPFYIKRLAYYQSGKAILHSILPTHPPVVFLNLLSQAKKTRRSTKFFIEKQNQFDFEMKLIGFYSGKAAELLTLHGNINSNYFHQWQSDLGFDELLLATFITNVMLDKFYFYSKQLVNRKNHYQITNQNDKQYRDFEKTERICFFQKEIDDEITIEKLAQIARLEQTQQRAFGPWWQIQVTKQTSEIASFFADWYRFYIPDPEESLLNLDWIPPDDFYHSNNFLKNILKDPITKFNDLYTIERDFLYQSLILNSFNNAFCFLEENREFLDYFSDLIIRYENLRQNKISSILNKKREFSAFIKKDLKDNNDIKIIEKFWGKNSRRKYSRFISIKTIKRIKFLY